MSDTGAVLDSIRKDFEKRLRGDRTLKEIAKRVRNGSDYADAGEYAVRVGELLAKTLEENAGAIPDTARITGEEILRPLFEYEHDLAAEAARVVTENLNAEGGFQIKALTADYEPERVGGIIDHFSKFDTPEEGIQAIEEPAVNYGQSVVDRSLEKNAEASAKAGIQRYIIRKAEASAVKTRKITRKTAKGTKTYKSTYKVPCEWCEGLAGTYEYKGNGSNVPRDVYRRHLGCRCTLTFRNGNRAQNVWDHGQTWDAEDAQGSIKAAQQVEERRTREQEQKIRRMNERAAEVREIMRVLGYNERGAAIFRNNYAQQIGDLGLDEVLRRVLESNGRRR